MPCSARSSSASLKSRFAVVRLNPQRATRAAFTAASNSDKGDGERIARAIHEAGDALSLADLHTIATAASMEQWSRVAAAGRTATPGARVRALVPAATHRSRGRPA